MPVPKRNRRSSLPSVRKWRSSAGCSRFESSLICIFMICLVRHGRLREVCGGFFYKRLKKNGRGACRGRGEISVGGGSLKKKKKKSSALSNCEDEHERSM